MGERMHADEVRIDADLVRSLLAAQFPRWARLPLTRVVSTGTVNALYRLGSDMVVRLPRIPFGVDGLARETHWQPRLAPRLPVAIPQPLGIGRPAEGYPFAWAVSSWIDGSHPSRETVSDFDLLAGELARFVVSLHSMDLADGPPVRRGCPLAAQDEHVRAALAELGGMVDVVAALEVWSASLKGHAWSGAPVWVHGDLLPGNLLVVDGHLDGVIDWGGVGVGDPACDMLAAWAVLPARSRKVFRIGVGVDEATWARGRGWALSIGLVALPYYVETNPLFAATARRIIDEVLADRA